MLSTARYEEEADKLGGGAMLKSESFARVEKVGENYRSIVQR